jgi:hypothetical protein
MLHTIHSRSCGWSVIYIKNNSPEIVDIQKQRMAASFSLTVITITLTVCVIYMDVFVEHETCFLVSKQKRRLWNTKSKLFFNMTHLEGRPRCQTKSSSCQFTKRTTLIFMISQRWAQATLRICSEKTQGFLNGTCTVVNASRTTAPR